MEALELLGLDMDQTEILYNFQFLKTVEDIKNEKNQTLKEEKTKWLNEWQNGIELVFSETYQDYIIEWVKDEEELKNWISRKEVELNFIWLDLVTLETYVFEPYYPLNTSDKKSKIKYNSKNSWLEEFIVSNFMSKELYWQAWVWHYYLLVSEQYLRHKLQWHYSEVNFQDFMELH